MSSDINRYSFVGPDDNGKTVVIADGSLPPGTNWASLLKVTSECTDLVLSVPGEATGGHDAVLDINNKAKRIQVAVAVAKPTGQFLATVKGGASDGLLDFPCIDGHGSVCDFIFNDYSDQDPIDSVSGWTLKARMKDGSPVYVIPLKAKPTLAPGSGPYKFPWWSPFNLRITKNIYVVGSSFNTLRRWGFFRSAANQPTP